MKPSTLVIIIGAICAPFAGPSAFEAVAGLALTFGICKLCEGTDSSTK